MIVYIYGLVDPTDRSIRYIGQSVTPHLRLLSHLADGATTDKTAWFEQLAESGLSPELVILDAADQDSASVVELEWIYFARKRGWNLTNTVGMKTRKYRGMSDDLCATIFVETGFTHTKFRSFLQSRWIESAQFFSVGVWVVLLSLTMSVWGPNSNAGVIAMVTSSVILFVSFLPFVVEGVYSGIKDATSPRTIRRDVDKVFADPVIYTNGNGAH